MSFALRVLSILDTSNRLGLAVEDFIGGGIGLVVRNNESSSGISLSTIKVTSNSNKQHVKCILHKKKKKSGGGGARTKKNARKTK